MEMSSPVAVEEASDYGRSSWLKAYKWQINDTGKSSSIIILSL